MNKIVKRTLIALFSVVFLVCTALFLAACAEDEGGTPHYKVTLEYEETQGTVTVTAPAAAEGYVKDESVTVTVAANLGYTQTAPAVTVNDTAVTLSGGSYTFAVAGDTTVKVTFTPDTNPDFLKGKQAFDFKNGIGFEFGDSQAVTTIEAAPESGTYSIGAGKVTINGTDYTVKGTTLTIDSDVYYISDIVNTVAVTEGSQTKNLTFGFDNAEWVADPVSPYVSVDIKNPVYDGHVGEGSYYDGVMSVRYTVAGTPEYIYLAEVDFADLTATNELNAVVVYTASTAATQYKAEINLTALSSRMTLYVKDGENYSVVFESVSRSNSSTTGGKEYFWQGTQTVGDLVTTYKATLTGATYSDQTVGGGTTEVGDYSAAVLVVENLGSVYTKTLATTTEDYKVTITYDTNNAITVTRLQKKDADLQVYVDIYGGGAAGAECTGSGNEFKVTTLDSTELTVYTITFTGSTPAEWSVGVTAETTKITRINTLHDADHAYYQGIILAVDDDGVPTQQGVIGSFSLEYVDGIYMSRTITVQSCSVATESSGHYTVTVTDTDDNEIEFKLNVGEVSGAKTYEMYEELTITDEDAFGLSATFAVAGGQPSAILSVSMNYGNTITDMTTTPSSTNLNVWTVEGLSQDGKIEYVLTVTFVPATSDPASITIVTEKSIYTFEAVNEADSKTYVVKLDLKLVDSEYQIADVVSVQFKNDGDAPNTDVVLENDGEGNKIFQIVGEKKQAVWFNATYDTGVDDDGNSNEPAEISLYIKLNPQLEALSTMTITVSFTNKEVELDDGSTYMVDLVVRVYDETEIVSVTDIKDYNEETSLGLDMESVVIAADKHSFTIEIDEIETKFEIYDANDDPEDPYYMIKTSSDYFVGQFYDEDEKFSATLKYNKVTQTVSDLTAFGWESTYSGYGFSADCLEFDYPISSDKPVVYNGNTATVTTEELGKFIITVTLQDYGGGLFYPVISVEAAPEQDSAYLMCYDCKTGDETYVGYVAQVIYSEDGVITGLYSLNLIAYYEYEYSAIPFELEEIEFTPIENGVSFDYEDMEQTYEITVVEGVLNVTTKELAPSLNGKKFYDFKNGDFYSFTKTEVTVTPKSGEAKSGTYTFEESAVTLSVAGISETSFTLENNVLSGSSVKLLAIGADSIFTVGGKSVQAKFTGTSADDISLSDFTYDSQYSSDAVYADGKVTFSVSGDKFGYSLDMATLELSVVKVTLINALNIYKLEITWDGSKYQCVLIDYVGYDNQQLGAFEITSGDVQDGTVEPTVSDYKITLSNLGSVYSFEDMATFFANVTFTCVTA